MLQFVDGVLTTECLVAGLFFAKYSRTTGDRFFVYFALSFLVRALHWFGLAAVSADLERWNYAYLARLIAFDLMIAGIIDKNRRNATARRASQPHP